MNNPLRRWLQAILPPSPRQRQERITAAVRQFHPGQEALQGLHLPRVDCVEPALLALSGGQSYLWCSCGLSRRQPFCDGSHAGTGLRPLRFTPARNQIFWLCNCKYTRTPPYCDAAHNRLAELRARWPGES